MNIGSIIGNNLRSYRKKRKITQEKLGELSGVHRTTVGSIERGEINPGSSTVQDLADALDIAAMQLLAEFDESGCLVIGRSTKYLRENDLETQRPHRQRGREKKCPENQGQPQINYGIISWSGNILYDLDIEQEDQEFAAQVLYCLKKYGCSDDDLIPRFGEIWPTIKALVGAD